jgi:hypothetical protein
MQRSRVLHGWDVAEVRITGKLVRVKRRKAAIGILVADAASSAK